MSEVGYWGQMRDRYLEEHKHFIWSEMNIEGTLKQHLLDIDQTAEEMKETMIPRLMKKFEVTEELKAENQMEWVRRVNQIRQIIREQILNDLIYS
ncbi:TnpV protein [Ihubacter sp. mB4P-1]